MNEILKNILPIILLMAFSAVTSFADDLETLSGKWMLKRANDEGQIYSRVLEINNDKFIFRILNNDGNGVFYAVGNVQLQKLGPFNSIKFMNMEIGESVANTQAFDEDRVSIYQLAGDTLTLASDFDAQREQKPSLDVYQKAAATANEPRTLFIDKVVMHQTPQDATWFFCFEAKTDGATQRYRVPKESFDQDRVTISTNLKVPNVRPGQICTFKCQLDDVEEDVCTDDIDNTSSGRFTVSESGSQEYKPEGRWRYTVYWHLK